MKIIQATLVAAALIGMTVPSFAACPKGTRYQCSQAYNGKMNCGCY